MTLVTWIRPSGTEIVTGDSEGCFALAAREGWKLKQDEAEVEVIESTGDHESQLGSFESKDQVAAYLESQEIKIDMRGGLDIVKEKALTALRGE